MVWEPPQVCASVLLAGPPSPVTGTFAQHLRLSDQRHSQPTHWFSFTIANGRAFQRGSGGRGGRGGRMSAMSPHLGWQNPRPKREPSWNDRYSAVSHAVDCRSGQKL